MIDKATQARWDAEDTERDARLGIPGALLRSAIWYAQHGIAVFPLHPGTKIPATDHGFKDATTDQQRIRNWWNAGPQRNIGLPTGIKFDVIDVDGPKGYLSLANMLIVGEVPPILGKAHTPSGGRHLYIKPTGSGNAASYRPSVDFRGLGGFVVAPPSYSAELDKRWAWIAPLELP